MEGTQGVYIFNNTFYDHFGQGTNAHVWVDNNNSSVKVLNNIFYSASTNDPGGVELFVRAGQNPANVEANHNLYFRTGANLRIVEKEYAGTFYMGDILRIRSGFGWEMNSPAPANPLFFSGTDFHLCKNSPAINKGEGITIMGLPIDKDFDGRNFNNPPSIGAFEFDPAYVAPTIPASAKGQQFKNMLKGKKN